MEPIRHEVESQVDRTVGDARQEKDQPEQTSLQKAIQRTVKELKQTMQWLARTLRALLKTVVALLKAVVNLVVVILLALFEGLKSLGGSIMGGAKSAGEGIAGGIKNMLVSGGKALIESLLPDMDSESDDEGEKQGKQRSESKAEAAYRAASRVGLPVDGAGRVCPAPIVLRKCGAAMSSSRVSGLARRAGSRVTALGPALALLRLDTEFGFEPFQPVA
jgi:hypothetical protein